MNISQKQITVFLNKPVLFSSRPCREDCWAGPLYDRDQPAPPPKGDRATSRVIAIGDAAHPMSPFKGRVVQVDPRLTASSLGA